MKTVISVLAAGLISLVASSSALAGNVAECEIAISKPVLLDGKQTGAHIQTYLPASEYIASVYDEDDGHLTEIDGGRILALYCVRREVVPTVRDFNLIATGIPMALSTDFDDAASPLIYVYYKDGVFKHAYEGPEQTPERLAALNETMEVLNLQPHKLKK